MTAEADQVNARGGASIATGRELQRGSRQRLGSSGRQGVTPALPVPAAVMARLPWLLVGALAGGLLGGVLAGGSGSVATSTLQVTNGGADSARVRQVAQTLQQLVKSSPVLESAARARNMSATDLSGRVTSSWVTESDLVTVSVTGVDGPTAVADVNAVAEAAVGVTRANVRARLSQLRVDANRLLTKETLANKDAESARRTAIGAALAARQDSVSADTEGIVIADPAVSAVTAGLSRSTGAVAGLLGGLLLAMLLAVLAGARALRVGSGRQVHALLPHADLSTTGDAAKVAGHVVESGTSCLAIVSLPGAHDVSASFAMDVADFVKGHGRSVTVIDTSSLPTEQARRDVLRYDARTNVRDTYGTDVLVAVVDSEEDACGMLVGQSNLRAALVARQRRTPMKALVAALSSLDGAEPVVILAR